MEIVKKLARSADVVVENFRPGVKHRLGVDYEALSEENPRLIYASISGLDRKDNIATVPATIKLSRECRA